MKARAEEADALRQAGRPVEAVAAYRRLVGDDPQHAAGWHNLGALLHELGEPDEAERALRRAIALDPNALAPRHALGITLMTLGKFSEGLSSYRKRHALPGPNKPERPAGFPFPELANWDVAGKHVAVFPEQGQGDQIMLARFVPELVRAGAEVTMLTRAPLTRLFHGSFPDVRVMTASGPVEFPDPDYWVMSSDLPGVAGATLATLPRPPYLKTDASWPALPDGFKIGLMTKGNPLRSRDALRSLSIEDARRLAATLPGTIIDLAPEKSGAADFADTAALIGRLDLVVTVDTSVAHLAGALGKRCLTLVPGYPADWRWMTGRNDSPWYPAMTLYRGSVGGDWSDAVRQLAAEAHRIAGAA